MRSHVAIHRHQHTSTVMDDSDMSENIALAHEIPRVTQEAQADTPLLHRFIQESMYASTRKEELCEAKIKIVIKEAAVQMG